MKEKEILEKFSIGSQIKSLRTEHKWTQQQLATKINVSSQVISNWERGYTVPIAKDIKILAKEFNVDTNMILTGHSNEEVTNYLTGTKAISTLVQNFADTYGDELVAQFFDNRLNIEDLLNSDIKITFNNQVLTKNEKQKIINLIKVMYQ
ncbi:helix-turn-helix transcriptional regulator [Bacillus cereus]|uniref:helix-turn-helix domain-containing protein n=1 Tax=Bacillus cereus TaxID=1396 RepID=UPI002406EF7A|nr:helix-turn-helix transcriptional regulator [Bacillus cereus]MDF9507330.1 helix-turn-helix transcriptional regulator [Bacillus cereus]MDF9596406.1 helix-turn-helix transcriptional regulator [Bacillus cereus]MDF9608007.1 helix-turn-helix transcriptional regulator [Bacillus cereus]MDF9659220.1 helix-turn-helix transcriptional regulator [Bacillus cereus]